MKQILYYFTLLAVLAGCSERTVVKGSWSFSPEPREIYSADSSFVINGKTAIVCSASLGNEASLLADYLYEITNIRPEIKEQAGEHSIILSLDPAIGSNLEDFRREECYSVNVSADVVSISAASSKGIFHGIQSFCKSLPASIGKGELAAAPAGRIFDYPEYRYRAFMLDCARHFFSVETVKRVIDILAVHKINYFHWHLTEDQGWRLEIKKYPRLTEVGSWRAGSPVEGGEGHDGIPVSGFYTQDEAREVVRYAAARGITVIPEIDMPGHMQAALASYPSLGCTGGPYEVACRYGVLDDVLCVGRDASIEFIKDVLSEVMDIFPSEYIHLGGDECPKVRWKECAHCQARIKELGIKAKGSKTAEELLQSWFMDEIARFVEERGHKVIAWNDVLLGWNNVVSGAPSKNTIIAGWMRPVSTDIAVKEGYNAILCPCGHVYFSAREGNALTGDAYLKRVFDLPVPPAGLSEEEAKRIIGIEACIWTEHVSTEDVIQWQMLPRLSALAELQWADPARRNYAAFLERLSRMTALYSARGWQWNSN